MDLSLGRIVEVLERLGNPQDRLKVVHVAGTNGKGSVCSYIEHILLSGGVKVGKFNSPHFLNIYDSIKVNKIPITELEFNRIKDEVKVIENELNLKLTNFELMATVSFLHFLKEQVQIAVIEVGLGGRYDATNVIKQPLVSIITPIAYDHVQLLGNTLSEIAYQKAGIIKEGGEVVISHMDEEATETIVKECKKLNANFIISGCAAELEFDIRTRIRQVEYTSKSGNCYRLPLKLLGKFQLINLAVSLEAIEALQAQTNTAKFQLDFQISSLAINRGISTAEWLGRLQFIQLKNELDVLVDGAHNLAATQALKEFVIEYCNLKYHSQPLIINWVYAATEGKDIRNQFRHLFERNSFEHTISHNIYLTKFSLPDMMPWIKCSETEQLKVCLNQLKDSNEIEFETLIENENLSQILNDIASKNSSNSLTIITGSLYLIADVFRSFV